MANRSGTYGAMTHRGRERDNDSSSDHGAPRSTAAYLRSDDRLREDIGECLTYDSLLDGAEIDVEVKEGQVILSGVVAGKSERLRAQDLAAQVYGVRTVRNDLRVRSPGGTTDKSTEAKS